MYGGHITDDWDRRLCVSYLEELMQPDLIDGELQLAPGKLTNGYFGYLILMKDNIFKNHESSFRFSRAP